MTGQSAVADLDFSVSSSAIRPPVIGYRRVKWVGNASAVQRWMAEYGDAARFGLGQMAVDCQETAKAALAAPVDVLPDSAAARVLVPSPAELASAWTLRMPVWRLVERQTGARVAVVPSAEAT